jgi:hypothetical protein
MLGKTTAATTARTESLMEHVQAETNREFRKALSMDQKNLEDGREFRIEMFKNGKPILFAESPAVESDGLVA